MVWLMPKVNGVLYGYCGLLCEFCKGYIEGMCPGCDAHTSLCRYVQCAIESRVKTCLACPSFPCKLHLEGFYWDTEEFGRIRWRVFSDILLKIFSVLKERG